jgi:hypothetical protein
LILRQQPAKPKSHSGAPKQNAKDPRFPAGLCNRIQ